MISTDSNWTFTLVFATLAVTLAAVGLGLTGLSPGLAPLAATSLLLGSLAFTAAAFARVALRVRRLELENEGLIEEISQEFDRVKDKLEIFREALTEPLSLQPQDVEANTPMRRITIK